MAWRVICKQCGANSIVETADNPQTAVGCNCCTQPHDHDAAANACPGAGQQDHTQQHPGVPCAHPMGGAACNAVTEQGVDCPGGHCFPGVAGCTVCRPLTLEFVGIAPVGLVS